MSIDKCTNGKENQKLICIGRTEIENHYTKIEIPKGSKLLRTKSKRVIFYIGMKPERSKNGWSNIPEDKGLVCFPGYREASGSYGKPEYS